MIEVITDDQGDRWGSPVLYKQLAYRTAGQFFFLHSIVNSCYFLSLSATVYTLVTSLTPNHLGLLASLARS